MTKNDVYQVITDRIIAALDAGTVPWRKPWTGGHGMPVNVRNGRAYRGVNVLLLGLAGYSDPRWGTYKAISESGGQVRKGEKGTQIILWKPAKRTETDANGEKTESGYLLLRTFVVFNASQADGLPALPEDDTTEHERNERAEQVVSGYKSGPGILHGFDGASYSPEKDLVRMPDAENFHDPDGYYQTLFHELAHSTGHESRLDRLEPALFGSDPYAREELVAEIGASMLAGLVGMDSAGGDNSAAYLASWAKRFRDDSKLIVNAAAQAQKAADRILGETFAEEAIPPLAIAA